MVKLVSTFIFTNHTQKTSTKLTSNSYNSNEGKFNIYITPAPKTVNNSGWQPRGPTALPYTSFVPETGKFGVGSEDPNNPLIAMDQIVNAEIAKVKVNFIFFTTFAYA